MGCHYKFNGRHDHAYWIDGREKAKVSDAVTEKLKRWQAGEKLIPDPRAEKEIFPTLSWGCLFAGTGLFGPVQGEDDAVTRREQKQMDDLLTRYSRLYKTHEKALQALQKVRS